VLQPELAERVGFEPTVRLPVALFIGIIDLWILKRQGRKAISSSMALGRSFPCVASIGIHILPSAACLVLLPRSNLIRASVSLGAGMRLLYGLAEATLRRRMHPAC
jgi:hypothetical protein